VQNFQAPQTPENSDNRPTFPVAKFVKQGLKNEAIYDLYLSLFTILSMVKSCFEGSKDNADYLEL
jgi:hypothetical protein